MPAAGAMMHKSLNRVTVSARSRSGPAALTIGSSEHTLTRIVADRPWKSCETSTLGAVKWAPAAAQLQFRAHNE